MRAVQQFEATTDEDANNIETLCRAWVNPGDVFWLWPKIKFCFFGGSLLIQSTRDDTFSGFWFDIKREVVFCPAGFIFVEKALVSNNLMYRVTTNFIDHCSVQTLQQAAPYFQKKLGPNSNKCCNVLRCCACVWIYIYMLLKFLGLKLAQWF